MLALWAGHVCLPVFHILCFLIRGLQTPDSPQKWNLVWPPISATANNLDDPDHHSVHLTLPGVPLPKWGSISARKKTSLPLHKWDAQACWNRGHNFNNSPATSYLVKRPPMLMGNLLPVGSHPIRRRQGNIKSKDPSLNLCCLSLSPFNRHPTSWLSSVRCFSLPYISMFSWSLCK